MQWRYSYMYRASMPWRVTAPDAGAASPAAARLLSNKGVQHRDLQVKQVPGTAIEGMDPAWSINCLLFGSGCVVAPDRDQAVALAIGIVNSQGREPEQWVESGGERLEHKLYLEYVEEWQKIGPGLEYEPRLGQYKASTERCLGDEGRWWCLGAREEVLDEIKEYWGEAHSLLKEIEDLMERLKQHNPAV